MKFSPHLGLCPVSIKVLHGSWLNPKCPCIGYFSLGCDKAPDTGSLGRKAILPCSQGMQSLAVVAGAGAAGHTVMAVRKQRRWRLVSAAFPLLIQSRVKRHRCELYSSPSVKPFWKHPKVHFQAILNPLKLAMKINSHTMKTHVLRTCSSVAQLGGDGSFMGPRPGKALRSWRQSPGRESCNPQCSLFLSFPLCSYLLKTTDDNSRQKPPKGPSKPASFLSRWSHVFINKRQKAPREARVRCHFLACTYRVSVAWWQYYSLLWRSLASCQNSGIDE